MERSGSGAQPGSGCPGLRGADAAPPGLQARLQNHVANPLISLSLLSARSGQANPTDSMNDVETRPAEVSTSEAAFKKAAALHAAGSFPEAESLLREALTAALPRHQRRLPDLTRDGGALGIRNWQQRRGLASDASEL